MVCCAGGCRPWWSMATSYNPDHRGYTDPWVHGLRSRRWIRQLKNGIHGLMDGDFWRGYLLGIYIYMYILYIYIWSILINDWAMEIEWHIWLVVSKICWTFSMIFWGWNHQPEIEWLSGGAWWELKLAQASRSKPQLEFHKKHATWSLAWFRRFPWGISPIFYGLFHGKSRFNG